jgi:integrase/recombinase XerD
LTNGDKIGIRVEGKRSIRIVPLTPNLTEDLNDYLQARKTSGEKLRAENSLFIAIGNRAGGKRLSRRGIRQIVDRYLQATNLKYLQGRTIYLGNIERMSLKSHLRI